MPSMMGGRPRMRMGRDYRMVRDSRMPYPYVDSRRTRMDRMPRGMSRDYNEEYDSRYDYESYDRNYRQPIDREYDMESPRNIKYYGRYGNTPFELRSMENYPIYDYRMYPDYGYDYAMGEHLSEREIEDWTHELLEHIDDKDREMLKKEKILKRAEEMGIQFDKFTKDEFYTVVVMEYTDHCKTFGSANMDTYIRMAKDWLMDDDVKVKHGEKLATYHDYIVKGY